jgi:hypothetical protein
VTDETGKFRFLNQPPGPYSVTFDSSGFAGVKHEGVIVAVGRDADISVTLKLATVAESITVTGESPIVDTKVTGTATNFTTDELTKIPTSRDPFALMRSVPGVLVDRVNIGGNETGQQSNFASKGTRPQDASWTMDGIEITDMAATGASPTYFNFDNFEEIQVSTAGNDIKSRTGGMGLNLVVKRGTNSFSGMFRGYFDNDAMESTTCRTSWPRPAHARDRGSQQADLGLRLRHRRSDHQGQGVVLRLVFDPGRAAGSPRRRAGRSHAAEEPDGEGELAGDEEDNVSFLFFDGFKIKDGRSPGVTGILFDAPTATFHQDNAYTDFPLHGLWKVGDDHTFGTSLFVSANYGYYNTGFILDPVGGLDMQAGRNFVTAQSYGSVSQGLNVRPQKVFNVNAQSFTTKMGASHDVKFGVGYRTTDAVAGTLWPGQRHPGQRARQQPAGAGVPRGPRRQPRQLPELLRRRHDRHEPRDGRSRRAFRSPGRRGAAERDAGQPGVPVGGARHRVCRLQDAVHVEQLLAARRRDLRARREPQDGGARQLQPLRRSAQHRHGRRAEPELGRPDRRPYRWTDTNAITSRRRVKSISTSSSRRPAASIPRTRRR